MSSLEPTKPSRPARRPSEGDGVWRVVERLGPGRSVAVGLLLVAAGVGSALSGIASGLVALGTSAALTMGAGLAALGLYRMRRPHGFRALPGASGSPTATVLEERARRIRRLMSEGGGTWTFDLLLARLSWTERALTEALIYMRDRGQIVEDLDLDTGKWVYRLHEGEPGTPPTGGQTLDERLRRLTEGPR